jgi:hypothetical protein
VMGLSLSLKSYPKPLLGSPQGTARGGGFISHVAGGGGGGGAAGGGAAALEKWEARRNPALPTIESPLVLAPLTAAAADDEFAAPDSGRAGGGGSSSAPLHATASIIAPLPSARPAPPPPINLSAQPAAGAAPKSSRVPRTGRLGAAASPNAAAAGAGAEAVDPFAAFGTACAALWHCAPFMKVHSKQGAGSSAAYVVHSAGAGAGTALRPLDWLRTVATLVDSWEPEPVRGVRLFLCFHSLSICISVLMPYVCVCDAV